MLELSRGEIAVVVFVFLLVYGGLWAPRLGERLALRLAGKNDGTSATRRGQHQKE